MKMTTEQIRAASNETLKAIFAGVVREACDRMSRGIAHDELERRGIFKQRF